MATRKTYAYYIEGNKIGLAQKETDTTSTDLRSEDYGKYKSPQTAVTDGLEIKYTYSPDYRINDADDTIAITAYTESNGLLSLTVASMSITADSWILITGSSKINGLHQVNATISGATTLVLKTKYNGGAVTESSTLYQDVSKMEDESFELDLPRYLQNAVVYYLKAQMFEDVGDFQKREFYLREFKRQVEKHNSGKVTTTHRIQGFWGMNQKL